MVKTGQLPGNSCLWLGVFKLGDEVLDLLVVDAKISGFRVEGDFILGGGYEC